MIYDAQGRAIAPLSIGFVPTRPTREKPLVGDSRADAVAYQSVELEPDEDE